MPKWFATYLQQLTEQQADELTDWLENVDLTLLHTHLVQAILDTLRENPKYYTTEALERVQKLPEA